jgi:hypothetical protein
MHQVLEYNTYSKTSKGLQCQPIGSLPPLQAVEEGAAGTMEGSWAGYGLESETVSARANIRAVFHGDMRPSGDGFPRA